MALRGILYGGLGVALARARWGTPWAAGDLAALAGERRAMVAFLAYGNVNTLLAMVPRQLVFLIIGYYRPPAEVGYYKLGTAVANVTSYLISPLQRVTYPDLAAALATHGPGAVVQRGRRLLLRAGIPVAALTLMLTLLVPYSLPRIFGSEYTPAVATTELLIVTSAWQALWFWLRPAYMAAGALNAYVWIASAATGLLLAVWLLMIPALGAVGAAAVLLASSMLHLGVTAWWFFHRVAPADPRRSR
jgi:O-antigen/teichoic acid export membrane protein